MDHDPIIGPIIRGENDDEPWDGKGAIYQQPHFIGIVGPNLSRG